MNTNESYKINQYKKRLNTLKLGNNLKVKNHANESKKEESSSISFVNSIKYLTNFDESSFDSKKLHFIKKPYKIFMPIKSKMKKIKDSRKMSLNSYHKKALRRDLIFKENANSINTSFNFKDVISKDFKLNPKKNKLKSTFNISNSYHTNFSKNLAIMTTERTSSTKELTNINISKISKLNNIDKYLSHSILKNLNNNNNFKETNSQIKHHKISNYRIFKFLSLNEGYKNLPALKKDPKHFLSDIKTLTKERFLNFCLKEKEATIKSYKECHDDNFKIEIKKKIDNRNLFDIFYKDYITYYKKLKSKTTKDSDQIKVLKWEIICYKNEVNRLKIKKEKLLAKLNKYIKMKHFLIKMRNYSLDKKDDSWMFKKTEEVINKENLIKEKRRIKDTQDNQNFGGNLVRRGSVNYDHLSKFSSMLMKSDSNIKTKKKKLVRMNSLNEKNPLVGSGIKEISYILNNHITNLLIYQNQLRIDLEPLREEFDRLFKSLKQSEERENELLKLEFLVLPEKKRIAKERNEFLSNTLYNINHDLYISSKYNKMNELIIEKLIIIYRTLVDNKIIRFTRMKPKLEENDFEKLLFYLKNIEKGLVVLNQDKQNLEKNYSSLYAKLIKEINDDTKRRTLENQRKMELSKINKQRKKLIDRMTKTFVLNKHKDYYEFGYKKPKAKIVYKKTDPYDELRYGDDSEESEKD